MPRPRPHRILWLLVLLSLLPAAPLVADRIAAEGGSRTVTMVMDEPALREQADAFGLDAFELALRYRELGLTGIVLYEETLESLAADGAVAYLRGYEARALAAVRGEDPAAIARIPPDGTLATELEPGALAAMRAKNRPEAAELELAGRTWYVWPGDAAGTRPRPAGPDLESIRRYAEAGFDIAYRPRNAPGLVGVGEDFPEEARYLIHAGLQVAGWPGGMDELVAASQDYLTVVIEGTEQDGMERLARRVPTTRLLSFNQDYINQRLEPAVLADKYLLAANERGIRMLYLRPYTEEQLGPMIENTERLVSGLARTLEAEGYTVAPLRTLELDYETRPLLRALASLGVLAGLGLLALMFPGAWGVAAALAVLGLGVLAGGLDWDALALAAALAFPVIGYGHLSERLRALPLATLVSLAGAVLLAAVGSDREAMLAIDPFAGVAATLVVPPLLFAAHYALRYRPPARWLTDFWSTPIRVGTVLLGFVGVAALGVVVLRRGNFPVIGATEAELALRSWLADLFVRPRFKELLGHPLAVLGLAGHGWPAWIRGALLTGGVVAQASVLNSFSHYHTPLLVSLQRTLIALALGLLIGLVLLPLVRLAVAAVRRWLASAPRAPQA